jgi:hypothetical protein
MWVATNGADKGVIALEEPQAPIESRAHETLAIGEYNVEADRRVTVDLCTPDDDLLQPHAFVLNRVCMRQSSMRSLRPKRRNRPQLSGHFFRRLVTKRQF